MKVSDFHHSLSISFPVIFLLEEYKVNQKSRQQKTCFDIDVEIHWKANTEKVGVSESFAKKSRPLFCYSSDSLLSVSKYHIKFDVSAQYTESTNGSFD